MINHYKQTEGELVALLYALSFATGLGFGGDIEHGVKSAYLGLQIADAIPLPQEDREAIFYGTLLKDAACTACAAGIAAFFPDDEQITLSQVILIDPASFSDMIGWLSRYVPLDSRFPTRIARLLSFMVQCGPIVKETMRSHCEVAELFARQLGFSSAIQQALRFQWERWDGRGMAYGLKGPAVPITARILHLAQVIELTYRFSGAATTERIIREKRGKRFDPESVDIFLSLASQEGFWEAFERATPEAIMAQRPPTQAGSAWEHQIERVCEALADFVDLKSRDSWRHSRTVAEIAVGIGSHLGLRMEELVELRCAALVHDLGKVAIPVGILTKGERRSASDWETYRLHPYYTQSILERVASLQNLAQAAAAHHEWINGQGYHRQLYGEQIPFHGRIIAIANAYARLIQWQGKRGDQAEVLRQLGLQVGVQFDRTCYEALIALLTETGGTRRPITRISYKKGSLTERECEVLTLLARGHNTPQIGRILGISKKTVEHHLTHIYNKIGVTCRTAAVVYAVQQGLV